MAPTTDIRDCQKFASAITAAGGTVPDVLGHLLSAYQLLASPARAQRPESDILTHALDGTLDQKTLDRLLPAAATAAMATTYRGELARQSEHTLVGQFHRELEAGAADEILASMRPVFDRHAAAIATARTLIDPESTAEQVIESGQPELVTAWQTLDGHIAAISRIAVVARAFGPRLGNFPRITEFALGENFRLTDTAILCTDGGLEADNGLFSRPDQGHRTSPFFRTTLRLYSIQEAQARYNKWAEAEHDRIHSGPRGGWIDASGQMQQYPAPENPYRTTALVKG